MVWIAICLPQLPIEVFAGEGPLPIAVDDGHRLLNVNDVARCAGVDPGMRRATALALCPALRLQRRDLARERTALEAIAAWALQFTPNVSLLPPCEELMERPIGLLFEVRGSLRLFGGLAPIVRALARGLAAQGHVALMAVAPVPEAAWLLARAPRERGDGRARKERPRSDDRGHSDDGACSAGRDRNPGLPVVAQVGELREALRPLPVWLLGPGSRYWDKLQNVGLKTIGDLLELPRAGIARRFSEALLDELDRALGEKPDPRDWFPAPPVFDVRVELAARVDSAEALLFAARRLLVQLAGWLASRHTAARTLGFTLIHEGRAPTALPLQLADATSDEERFTALLREVLGRTQLAAPVYELALSCTDIVEARPSSSQLFPAPHAEREGLMRLLERLQARLGRRQVTQLRLREDHRPEFAFCAEPASAGEPHRPASAGESHRPAVAGESRGPAKTGEPRASAATASGAGVPASTAARPDRPLWLLPDPVALAEHNNAPVCGTPLTLVSGPERIEGGWWDGAWAERDYFVARDGDDALLWIFRLRSPAPGTRQGWYLHGKFG